MLNDIDAGDNPIVRVFNKIDALESEGAIDDVQLEAAMMPEYAVAISALSGEGMVDFVATVEDALMNLLFPVELLIPYTNGKEVRHSLLNACYSFVDCCNIMSLPFFLSRCDYGL